MLLQDTIITEPEAELDHENRDADRFIAQSTLGIIQGCMADCPDPKDVENDVENVDMDEQRASLSTGLGEQHVYPVKSFAEQI